MVIGIQFGLYLLLMLGIGYYSMRKTKNNEDFIIGGRTLGPVTSAISAGASFMAWGFGYFGQPHILARFIGIRGVDDVMKARRIGMIWMILCLVLAVIIGIVGIGYNEIFPIATVSGPDGNKERIFLAIRAKMTSTALASFSFKRLNFSAKGARSSMAVQV